MNYIKLITLLVFFALVTITKGIGQDLSKEKKEMIAEMGYAAINNLKNSLKNWQPEKDTIIKYDLDHFLKLPLTKSEKQNIIKAITNQAKLELIYDGGFKDRYSILLQCDLPLESEAGYKSKFKLDLLSNNMTLGIDTFPLKQSALDGSSEKEISYLMMSDYEIDTTQIIGGSCEFEIEFLSGYEKKELTSENIGDSFKMLSKEYTLIDIVDNYVVIEDNSIDKSSGFGIINFVTQDSVVQSGNFKSEMMYELKKDVNYKHHTDMASRYSGIVAEIYKIFRANPAIEKEDFIELFYPMISEDVMSNYYLLLISKMKIGEKFIFYVPIYEKEVFVVEY